MMKTMKQEVRPKARPPDARAFLDMEIMTDGKYWQLTQLSCLLVSTSSEKSFFAAIVPTFFQTYSKYRQSIDLLTVLGHEVNPKENKVFLKDTSTEVCSEPQALQRLMEFLEGTRIVLFISSPSVLAMLNEKIGPEWVREKVRSVTLLREFLSSNKIAEPVSADLDIEEIANKVMSPNPLLKLKNCSDSSLAMHMLTVWAHREQRVQLSLHQYILSSSQPLSTIHAPQINLQPLGLDERLLKTIEVRNFYHGGLCTIIQLKYIDVHQVVDMDSDVEDQKYQKNETEYTEDSKIDIIDLDDSSNSSHETLTNQAPTTAKGIKTNISKGNGNSESISPILLDEHSGPHQVDRNIISSTSPSSHGSNSSDTQTTKTSENTPTESAAGSTAFKSNSPNHCTSGTENIGQISSSSGVKSKDTRCVPFLRVKPLEKLQTSPENIHNSVADSTATRPAVSQGSDDTSEAQGVSGERGTDVTPEEQVFMQDRTEEVVLEQRIAEPRTTPERSSEPQTAGPEGEIATVFESKVPRMAGQQGMLLNITYRNIPPLNTSPGHGDVQTLAKLDFKENPAVLNETKKMNVLIDLSQKIDTSAKCLSYENVCFQEDQVAHKKCKLCHRREIGPTDITTCRNCPKFLIKFFQFTRDKTFCTAQVDLLAKHVKCVKVDLFTVIPLSLESSPTFSPVVWREGIAFITFKINLINKDVNIARDTLLGDCKIHCQRYDEYSRNKLVLEKLGNLYSKPEEYFRCYQEDVVSHATCTVCTEKHKVGSSLPPSKCPSCPVFEVFAESYSRRKRQILANLKIPEDLASNIKCVRFLPGNQPYKYHINSYGVSPVFDRRWVLMCVRDDYSVFHKVSKGTVLGTCQVFCSPQEHGIKKISQPQTLNIRDFTEFDDLTFVHAKQCAIRHNTNNCHQCERNHEFEGLYSPCSSCKWYDIQFVFYDPAVNLCLGSLKGGGPSATNLTMRIISVNLQNLNQNPEFIVKGSYVYKEHKVSYVAFPALNGTGHWTQGDVIGRCRIMPLPDKFAVEIYKVSEAVKAWQYSQQMAEKREKRNQGNTGSNLQQNIYSLKSAQPATLVQQKEAETFIPSSSVNIVPKPTSVNRIKRFDDFEEEKNKDEFNAENEENSNANIANSTTLQKEKEKRKEKVGNDLKTRDKTTPDLKENRNECVKDKQGPNDKNLDDKQTKEKEVLKKKKKSEKQDTSIEEASDTKGRRKNGKCSEEEEIKEKKKVLKKRKREITDNEIGKEEKSNKKMYMQSTEDIKSSKKAAVFETKDKTKLNEQRFEENQIKKKKTLLKNQEEKERISFSSPANFKTSKKLNFDLSKDKTKLKNPKEMTKENEIKSKKTETAEKNTEKEKGESMINTLSLEDIKMHKKFSGIDHDAVKNKKNGNKEEKEIKKKKKMKKRDRQEEEQEITKSKKSKTVESSNENAAPKKKRKIATEEDNGKIARKKSKEEKSDNSKILVKYTQDSSVESKELVSFENDSKISKTEKWKGERKLEAKEDKGLCGKKKKKTKPDKALLDKVLQFWSPNLI